MDVALALSHDGKIFAVGGSDVAAAAAATGFYCTILENKACLHVLLRGRHCCRIEA